MWAETFLVPVPAPLIAREWTEDVSDLIDAANDRVPGELFDGRTLRAACLAGLRQLWLAKSQDELLGLGVTGVEEKDDGRRVLDLMLTAGRDWPSWSWMLGSIEAWGREQGCSICRIAGRKGWWRRLPAEYRLTGERCGEKGLIWEKVLCNG